MLDEHLNYDKAIIELSASAKRALGSIISKYKTNRNMGFSTYTILFHTCVLPIMTYCSSVWGHCNCEKLEQVYFSAMTAYMGMHKFHLYQVLLVILDGHILRYILILLVQDFGID